MSARCRRAPNSVHKGASRNISSLFAFFQFREQPKRIGASPGVGIRPDQHANYAGAAVGIRNNLLQHGDRLLGLIVGDEHESKIPSAPKLHPGELPACCGTRAKPRRNDGIETESTRLRRKPQADRVHGTPGPGSASSVCPGTAAISKSSVRSGVVRVQFEGAPVFSLGLSPLPLFLLVSASRTWASADSGSSSSAFWAGADALLGVHLSGRSADRKSCRVIVRLRQSDISRRKRRVSLYCRPRNNAISPFNVRAMVLPLANRPLR